MVRFSIADVTPKFSKERQQKNLSADVTDKFSKEGIRRRDPLPQSLRQEISKCARALAKNYAHVFAGDRRAKEQVIRFLRALLPPRRPRGRPRNPIVSRAILLFRRFRRKYPEESPRQLWSRVYPQVISEWETKSDVERRDARDELRERILWRRRKRRVRKIPIEISAS